ncbi:2-methyl-6-phytyl-1,4-hydroquinone methyltransferase, chloroplastic [Glycine max]|nr:2-methyl-6-phytyl-1,4-hydroquinone methyltransferase, chloroplastic [Glycine max]
MAYLMLSGAESTKLISGSGIAPSGFGSRNVVSYGNKYMTPRCSISSLSPASQPGFNKEAFWFYKFLATTVYDHVINPWHWTEDMRDNALEHADVYDRKVRMVDVEGGAAFTTLGIVKHVDAKNVTILDQSPHHLAKTKQKEPLKECKIIEGDAENLPFPTDYADHIFLLEGSIIEYWPDPQRGIKEAYRVLKIRGKACIIGPVYPTFWLSRFFADMWMNFPKEEEDIKLKRIGPKWYRGVTRHGLNMGCSVTGIKPLSGDSPLKLGPKTEDVKKPVIPLLLLSRLHVDQGQNYSKGHTHLRLENEVGVGFGVVHL